MTIVGLPDFKHSPNDPDVDVDWSDELSRKLHIYAFSQRVWDKNFNKMAVECCDGDRNFVLVMDLVELVEERGV